MTIEEKAQLYDGAIKVAMSKIKNSKDHVLYEEDITDIFPELKESEGERIRNFLIDFIKVCSWTEKKDQGWPLREECIAWLEKQGKPKEIDYDEELKKCRANPLYFFDKYMKVKLKEQEPTWSEEDEENFKDIVGAIHSVAYQTSEEEEARVDWLKSLKDRKDRILPQKQWKPTEEQINALKWQVDHTSDGLWQYKATKELLEQLKQL